jgi:hypothetical protein
MYKLQYFDIWGEKIQIPNELDKTYKTKKQAWWTHYNTPPISMYYEVVVVKI